MNSDPENTHIKDVEPGAIVERWFEEIEVGETRTAGPVSVTEDEIVRFASRYDPLPMHIDIEAAEASMHEGLISSGILTIALRQRLITSIERNISIIGAAGIRELNFLRPVRAGDELTLRRECLEKRESKSRPDRGLVTWQFDLTNQAGEQVLSSVDVVVVLRRPAA